MLVTNVHDPDGVVRRTITASFDEIASVTNLSPSLIYREAENRYSELVANLKVEFLKHKLAKEDWITVGQSITKFEADMKNLTPELGLQIINLNQALSEDLRKDVNTINAYVIYSIARQGKDTFTQQRPEEAIIECLKKSDHPLTPTEVSALSGVNYNTVRRVVQELLRNGQVTKGRGRGSYLEPIR